MKPFKSIQDVYLTGAKYDDTTIPEYQRFKSITEAYKLIKEDKNSDVLSSNAILSITGVDADIIINFYRYIIENKQLEKILDQVKISVGNPVHRAVCPEIHQQNYHQLSQYVQSIITEREDPFKITTAGVVKKLRTPTGGRVCEWSGLESRIDVLRDPANFNVEKYTRDVNFFRCISIVHLMHQYANNLEQVSKMPPGISYEIDQIETFNKSLEGLPKLGLILPGDSNVYVDKDGNELRIDGAEDVKGVPKADMSLTFGGESVFWISYKHGEYTEDVQKPGDIPFQQYGSPGGIYGDEDLKPVVDKFLTGVATKLGNYYSREDIVKTGRENPDARDGSLEKLMNVYGKKLSDVTKKGKPVGNVFNKHNVDHFHLFPSGESEIAGKLFDKDRKPLGGKLEMIGLKSIYGDEYNGDSSTPFGINNVNILLQTPQSATFEVITIDDEPIAIQMSMVKKSHIIKNPDLPDSVPYLPCMIIRHTMDNYFVFKNSVTNRMEAILGGRLLVYPQGKVSKDATYVDIFSE